MTIDFDRLSSGLAVLQVLVTAACLSATLAYIRQSHFFSLVLKYWATALFLVMALYGLDYAQLARYVDPPLAVATQVFLSCAANLVVVVLAWRAKAEAVGSGYPSKRTMVAFLGLTAAPAVGLLVVGEIPLGTASGIVPQAALVAANVYVDLFSFYALMRLAKWLAIYLISLRKVVALTLACYAALQLGLDWPVNAGILSGDTALDFTVWASCLTMVGKVAATIVVVAASSELSRRIQLKALGRSGLACAQESLRGSASHRRVVLIPIGAPNERLRPLLGLAPEFGLEFRLAGAGGPEVTEDRFHMTLFSRLAIVIVFGPGSDESRLLVSTFAAQRKDFLLLVASSAQSPPFDRSVLALGGYFSTDAELVDHVRDWLRSRYSWSPDMLLGSPSKLWKAATSRPRVDRRG